MAFLYETDQKKKKLPDIPEPYHYIRKKKYELLDAFMNSGMLAAEVKDFTQKTAKHCRNTLAASAKNFKIPVYVILREGHVYLIRKEQ